MFQDKTPHHTRNTDFIIFYVPIECLATGKRLKVRTGLFARCQETGGHEAQIKVSLWLQRPVLGNSAWRTLGFSRFEKEDEINKGIHLNSFATRIVPS